MDTMIEVFLMGDARLLLFVFLVVGVISYFVDYKKLRNDSETQREAKFSKGIAVTYIFGSLGGLALLMVVNWFV